MSPSIRRVSIVVPTHGRPEALSHLLGSIAQLAYPGDRLEVIIVGSENDPGRRVVQEHTVSLGVALTYHIVPNSAANSASFKRNDGARIAEGEILAFTDDDCLVHPGWISAGVLLFADPMVGAVEGGVTIPQLDAPTLTSRGLQRLTHPGGYQTCSMFYRKSVFDECGGFDLAFPYYLEDTDLAYSLMERGYTIPFAPMALVSHPVQSGRPLRLLTMARTVERVPYLFSKHLASGRSLRHSIRVLNRSHYPYLMLYATGALLSIVNVPLAAFVLVGGLGILVPLHLTYSFRGLHYTWTELFLTALCEPIVPVLRLFYWLKGWIRLHLGGSKVHEWHGMSVSIGS